MTLNSKKLFFIFLASFVLIIMSIVFGAYEINTFLASKANNLANLKAKSQALTDEQAILLKDKKNIAKYNDLYQTSKAIVPQDKDQAETVREITNIASNNGIVLSSITFPASTLGTSAITSAPSSTTSTNAAPTSTAPLRSPNSKNNKLSQLVAVPTIIGVFQLPITVQSDASTPITYDQFLAFLSALETNRRTSQISSLSITPQGGSQASKNANVSFTLNLNEYIKP